MSTCAVLARWTSSPDASRSLKVAPCSGGAGASVPFGAATGRRTACTIARVVGGVARGWRPPLTAVVGNACSQRLTSKCPMSRGSIDDESSNVTCAPGASCTSSRLFVAHASEIRSAAGAADLRATTFSMLCGQLPCQPRLSWSGLVRPPASALAYATTPLLAGSGRGGSPSPSARRTVAKDSVSVPSSAP